MARGSVFKPEAAKRISRVVRHVESERTNVSPGGNKPYGARQQLATVLITEDKGGGMYTGKFVRFEGIDGSLTFQATSSQICCQSPLYEARLREGIPVGTLVEAFVIARENDAESSFHPRLCWTFFGEPPTEFQGYIKWEEDGTRKLVINKGTVQIGYQDVEIPELEVSLVNSSGICSTSTKTGDCWDASDPSPAPSGSCKGTYYFISIDITTQNSPVICSPWKYTVASTIQSKDDVSDPSWACEWFDRDGGSCADTITWRIPIGRTIGADWEQFNIGRISRAGFVPFGFPIPCSVTKISGSPGGPSSKCSFAYSATDLRTGATYITGGAAQEPLFDTRLPTGYMKEASYGTVVVSQTGGWRLWAVDEQIDVDAC